MKEENKNQPENIVSGEDGKTCSLDYEGNWNCD